MFVEGVDISMISVSPDDGGDVQLSCTVCAWPWFDVGDDHSLPALVWAAVAHVRAHHLGMGHLVIDGVVAAVDGGIGVAGE
jgi:hypothetical protein